MMLCLQLYYHGEPISVNVHVTNNSTKTVKRVKISGTSRWRPLAEVCWFKTLPKKMWSSGILVRTGFESGLEAQMFFVSV